MRFLVLLALTMVSIITFAAGDDVPPIPVKTSASVISHEGTPYLAVHYENHPHWHTYWKNPGDAGLPTKIEFSSEAKSLELKEMPWATPKRYIENGNILAYGYDGAYTRFFKINDLVDGKKNFKITSSWLVCKHICIPGKVEMSVLYENKKITKVIPSHFDVTDEVAVQRLVNLPTEGQWPAELDIILKKTDKENQLVLYYNKQGDQSSASFYQSSNMLFPISAPLMSFGHEKLYYNSSKTISGRMTLEWDGEYETPEVPLPKNGKFEKPVEFKFLFVDPITKKATLISKKFSEFQPEDEKKMQSFLGLLTSIKPNGPDTKADSKGGHTPSQGVTNATETNFWMLLLFGFLGGLILNIMPCVLPVISLKLFGLIVHSDEGHSKILKHNLFYTLGVLSTFLVLALTILFIKNSGESIGWGFQLQSPTFVLFMVILLFVMALNLFGLFEFYTPGGKKLGNVELKKGFFGDFFGGVLATILSTPCSAPFLGTALTFAFSTSAFGIITIFLSIGLGLSFPFILTGIFPKTISFLPKPGLWMEKVKKFLGLTLLLTVVWLLDVYVALTDGGLSLLKVNSILVFLFFAFYFGAKISKNLFLRIIFFLVPIALGIGLIQGHMNPSVSAPTGSSQLIQDKATSGLNWKPWSQEAMDSHKKAGELVFIDFTAKWCFTCKVNEKVVLDTDDFRSLVKEKNIKLLLGDWTKKDPRITKFLNANGLVGVPAYFVQRPDGELINLGETITINKIKSNL